MKPLVYQPTFGDFNDKYKAFEEKFKPKKTTDDCYTPEPIYNAIRDWAVKEYHLEGRNIVRPFYPGGDYKRYADTDKNPYREGDVVIDNPPFSIISEIAKTYVNHDIPFFLFAPTLTLFQISKSQCCAIVANASITYANGAVVNTSFVTSLSPNRVEVRGDLCKLIEAANRKCQAKPQLPVITYPDCVISAAILGKIAKQGVNFIVPVQEAFFIRKLDAQGKDNSIFGAGYLISERLAAERLAAERLAEREAQIFELSDREKELQKMLNLKKGN